VICKKESTTHGSKERQRRKVRDPQKGAHAALVPAYTSLGILKLQNSARRKVYRHQIRDKTGQKMGIAVEERHLAE
jgi:hypothetical protein